MADFLATPIASPITGVIAKAIGERIDKRIDKRIEPTAKCRHPYGAPWPSLRERPNLPGERPGRLSGFRLAARASTLFPPLRPGRACLENSPACAPGKAGPTRFLRLRDASARDFVPPSAASARNQVGPVSPDAHASGAAGCFAPWFRPERAAPGQNGKIRPGGHFSSPPSWARVASVRLFPPPSSSVYQSGFRPLWVRAFAARALLAHRNTDYPQILYCSFRIYRIVFRIYTIRQA